MGSGRKISNSVTGCGDKINFRRYVLSPGFRGYCGAVFSKEYCQLLRTWERVLIRDFYWADSSLSPKRLAAVPSRLMKQRDSHGERRFGSDRKRHI